MGGDFPGSQIFNHATCFNPRPRMGGDELLCHRAVTIISFNPRPRMGGDRFKYC